MKWLYFVSFVHSSLDFVIRKRSQSRDDNYDSSDARRRFFELSASEHLSIQSKDLSLKKKFTKRNQIKNNFFLLKNCRISQTVVDFYTDWPSSIYLTTWRIVSLFIAIDWQLAQSIDFILLFSGQMNHKFRLDCSWVINHQQFRLKKLKEKWMQCHRHTQLKYLLWQ